MDEASEYPYDYRTKLDTPQSQAAYRNMYMAAALALRMKDMFPPVELRLTLEQHLRSTTRIPDHATTRL